MVSKKKPKRLTLPNNKQKTPRGDDDEDDDEFTNPHAPKFYENEFVLLKESEEEVSLAAKRVFYNRTRY